MGKVITIPLIKTGTRLQVPLEDLVVPSNMANYKIRVSMPAGTSFFRAIIGKGYFNETAMTWETGIVYEEEVLDALFEFVVTDTTKEPYDFKFYIDESPVCESYCVRIQGMTCSDISDCVESTYSTNIVNVTVPASIHGQTSQLRGLDLITLSGDVFPCASPAFTWENDTYGAIQGTATPSSFDYDAPANRVGTDMVTYVAKCDNKVVRKTNVNITLSHAIGAPLYIQVTESGTVHTESFSLGDTNIPCSGNAVTKWRFRGTNVQGVISQTLGSGFTMTYWDQDTGDFTVQVPASLAGIDNAKVFFWYTVQCTANGITTESGNYVQYIMIDIPV